MTISVLLHCLIYLEKVVRKLNLNLNLNLLIIYLLVSYIASYLVFFSERLLFRLIWELHMEMIYNTFSLASGERSFRCLPPTPSSPETFSPLCWQTLPRPAFQPRPSLTTSLLLGHLYHHQRHLFLGLTQSWQLLRTIFKIG